MKNMNMNEYKNTYIYKNIYEYKKIFILFFLL